MMTEQQGTVPPQADTVMCRSCEVHVAEYDLEVREGHARFAYSDRCRGCAEREAANNIARFEVTFVSVTRHEQGR